MKKVYTALCNRWIIRTFLILLTTLITIVVTFHDNDIFGFSEFNLWGLLDAESTYFIILTFLFAFILPAAIIDSWLARYESKNEHFYKSILQSISRITKERGRDILSENKITNVAETNSILLNPERQISLLIDSLKKHIAEYFALEDTEICISMLFKISEKDGWENWHYIKNGENAYGLSKEDIITNPKTTFKKMIDNDLSYIFFNSKNKGIKLNQYVPSSSDSRSFNREDKLNNHLKRNGSIFCKHIEVAHGSKIIITAALMLSTFNKKLRTGIKYPFMMTDELIEDFFNNQIFPYYVEQIKTELIILYKNNPEENNHDNIESI